jgi:4-amino-4-deoxy-L-arabinose transferase-like glycosyltransferase
MWFPVMARVGNDCLVVLLAAGAWLVLRAILGAKPRGYHYPALGVICGLGLLTKATFLPYVAAIAAVLLFRLWRRRGIADIVKRETRGFLVFVLLAAAIAGWWYAEKFAQTGSLIVSNEGFLLRQMGGLLHGLEQNGSPMLVLDGLLHLLTTFLWGGTLSFMTPPLVTYAPLLGGLLLLAWGFARQSRVSSLAAPEWLAMLTLAGLLAGLFNHLLVIVALYGLGAIGGWYLHSFAPVLAALVARGFAGLGRSQLRDLALAAGALALIFIPLALFAEAQYFSGCSEERAFVLYYDILSDGTCAADLHRIIANLAILAFPRAAVVLVAAGFLLTLRAAFAATRGRGDGAYSAASHMKQV